MNTRYTTTGRTRRTRRGFTLVEMLVAMALSLGIMLILAEAFQRSLDFVRIANANSQLMNQLAGAGNLLEHDLSAEHFLPEAGKPNGGVRLSDQRMDRLTATGQGWTRPRGGFFRIDSPIPAYEAAADREGNALSSAANHRLHFTSIFRGNGDAELFVASSPAGGAVYKSRAAEVAWYLVPTGEFTSPNAATRLPLYNLVRRYRLVAMDDDIQGALQTAVTNDPAVAEVMSMQTTPPTPAPGRVNTLATVANPANRLPLGGVNGPAPAPLAGARVGEEVVLTNVLSFQVLVWWDANTAGVTASNRPPRPYGAFPAGNTEAPYDYLFQGGGLFDTFVPGNTPAPAPVGQAIRVRSIQITVRIADIRVGIARSNTWKFAL
jgi:prepilin-type N-terminal cleavage/methylation domain-containing protein